MLEQTIRAGLMPTYIGVPERCKVGAWKKEKRNSRESTVFFDGYLGISDESPMKMPSSSSPKNGC